MTEPELEEDEFFVELTDVAKDAIRDHLVDDADIVEENPTLAAMEEAYVRNGEHWFIEEYPMAVETYGAEAAFGDDDWERLTTASPTEAIQLARQRMLQHLLEARIERLLDGEWAALVEETETVYEDVQVGDEVKTVEGEERYLVLDES